MLTGLQPPEATTYCIGGLVYNTTCITTTHRVLCYVFRMLGLCVECVWVADTSSCIVVWNHFSVYYCCVITFQYDPRMNQHTTIYYAWSASQAALLFLLVSLSSPFTLPNASASVVADCVASIDLYLSPLLCCFLWDIFPLPCQLSLVPLSFYCTMMQPMIHSLRLGHSMSTASNSLRLGHPTLSTVVKIRCTTCCMGLAQACPKLFTGVHQFGDTD